MIFRNSYTGQEFDSESGLFNYGGRPYDPFAGKFIQEDKIGFGGGDTNLSRYVFNSPTNLVDPIGNQAIRFLTPSIKQFPTNQLGVPDSRFNIDKNLIEIEDTFGKVKRGLLDFLTPPAGDPNADRNSRINQLKGVPLPRPGEVAPDKPKSPVEEDEPQAGKKPKPKPTPTERPKEYPKPIPLPFPFAEKERTYVPPCEKDDDKGPNFMIAQFQNDILARKGKKNTIQISRFNSSNPGVRVGQMVNAFLELYSANKSQNFPFPSETESVVRLGTLHMIDYLYKRQRSGGTDNTSGTIQTYQWDPGDRKGRSATNKKSLGKDIGDFRIDLENKKGYNLRVD